MDFSPPKKPTSASSHRLSGQLRIISLWMACCYLLSSCAQIPATFFEPTSGPESTITTEEPVLIEEALVRFRVTIPENPVAEDGIVLSILDEVTGLGLNISPYEMQREDATHYVVELPFLLNSVIKYRYTRQGDIPAEEHVTDGRQVRYRMYFVQAPGVIEDRVTRWTDSAYSESTGRVQGKVLDVQSSQPLANILITCGGAQAMTASDGSFLIEGLPPGVHNLVAYSLDGSYRAFQQGALVAAQSTTPANILLAKAPLVTLTFELSVPARTPPGIPLRIAGNLFQLGNTYANLSGGFSTIASRMPVMRQRPDGSYTLTISLPVGTDLRYKYTLGDGFWNAERGANGGFLVRQMIIPDGDQIIRDEVLTWSDGDGGYVTFDAVTPKNTPEGEYVSLQLNPYGWTEPLPMWNLGAGRWVYLLYSPLKPIRTLAYRYCRNDQCNAADALETIGFDSAGLPIDLSDLQNHPQDQISGWNWLQETSTELTVTNTYSGRSPDFLRGIAFQSAYHPSWQPHLETALAKISQLNANSLVLSPTWTYSRTNPPVLEQVNGQDLLWLDLINSITLTRREGLQALVYPKPNFPMPVSEWWASGTRDFSWWVVWFERYRVFLLHHADLASRSNAEALVIGGSWLNPALPGGTLADGSPSGVPEDAENRWRALITEIRSHFDGKLFWAVPFEPGNFSLPPFISVLDGTYLLWSARIAQDKNAAAADMAVEAGRLLDEQIRPALEGLGKPVYVAISYPSAAGSSTGCVIDPRGGCLDLAELLPPKPDVPLITQDFDDQMGAYYAMLAAVNERDWISGIVSEGYYPPALLMDKSTSIHGKPAAQVLQEAFFLWSTAP